MLVRTRPFLFIFISLIAISFLIPGCTPNQADDTLKQNGTSEPEDNPKLDYSLNQLVLAEWRGEAEEFAQTCGIELLYDDAGLVSIKVVLECLPGQVETATEVAEDYGTAGIIYHTSIQIVVPVTSLAALADEESIEFIRLPVYGVDAD